MYTMKCKPELHDSLSSQADNRHLLSTFYVPGIVPGARSEY